MAEPQTFSHVKRSRLAGPSRSSQPSGRFSERAHLLLTESFWDEEARTTTQRFYVIETASGDVTAHSLTVVVGHA